jgi:glycosyltransferase involved in cell wall biosynthesis
MTENLKNIIQKSIVCLPVFNEEQAIGKMIDNILELSIDLVITDGGSTDNSLKIAASKEVKVLHRPKKGKGYGMIQAMNYANEIQKEFIIYIDCDLTYPIDKIYTLLSEIEEADMVVGNRSYKNMRLKSRFLNFGLRILMLSLFFKYVKDTVSGFRIVKIERFLSLLKNQDMGTEIEMTAIAIKKEYCMKEIDIDYYTRVGKSKLSNKEILKAFIALLKARF